MTEVIGYNGPIYMTYPTKAVCPLLLVSDAMRSLTNIHLHLNLGRLSESFDR